MEKPFPLGSISWGTLRAQDLGPAFAETLAGLGDTPNVPDFSTDDEWEEFWQSEDGGYLIEEMMDRLNELAPPYVGFGASEGDGSDFGFWVDHDDIRDAIRFGEVEIIPSLDAVSSVESEYVVVGDEDDYRALYLVGDLVKGDDIPIWSI